VHGVERNTSRAKYDGAEIGSFDGVWKIFVDDGREVDSVDGEVGPISDL
jgi:hypothetical protein